MYNVCVDRADCSYHICKFIIKTKKEIFAQIIPS